MRPKIRTILEECIDTGIEHGLNMANKHTDNPTELNIKSCIEIAVWYEIDEHFDFDCHHALDKMVAHAEKHSMYEENV